MTKAERQEYMKVYNQSPGAIVAKKAWADSTKGQQYSTDYRKEYYAKPENKERRNETQRIRRQADKRKAEDAAYGAEYTRRPDIKAKKNAKRRERRKSDLCYRISERLRGRIKNLLGRNKPEASSRSLGCTAKQLLAHLEGLLEPGMSWDNYGFYGWHIDHIIPLSAFDLTDLYQYRKACHYTNLQPMWAKQNLQKGSKID